MRHLLLCCPSTLQKRQTLDAGEFTTVLARLVGLSPHNMYIECCISAYDLIKSDDRSSLQRDTLNDYMIVKMNMPPVADYDLQKATTKLMKAKNRWPQQQLMNGAKFKQQEYFVGFFAEARKSAGPKQKTLQSSFLVFLECGSNLCFCVSVRFFDSMWQCFL